MTVATEFDDTVLVVAVNVAEVDPAETVTEEGTFATPVLLLERVTVAPPDGAAPFKVTLPVELLPPVTEEGLNVTDDTFNGFTVKVALALPL